MRKLPFLVMCAVFVALGVIVYGCVPPSLSPSGNEMSAGERLYRGNCAACHRLLSPTEHDTPTWKHYITKYGQRLTAVEKQLVFDYLTRKANETSTTTAPSD